MTYKYIINHFIMKKSPFVKVALLISISVFTFSSIKKNDELITGCEPRPALSLPVNILDIKTSEDLFFSSTPKYQLKDLYFFNKSDAARKDTIRASVINNINNANIKAFLIPLTISTGDNVLIMKIKDNADDTIILSVKEIKGECSY